MHSTRSNGPEAPVSGAARRSAGAIDDRAAAQACTGVGTPVTASATDPDLPLRHTAPQQAPRLGSSQDAVHQPRAQRGGRQLLRGSGRPPASDRQGGGDAGPAQPQPWPWPCRGPQQGGAQRFMGEAVAAGPAGFNLTGLRSPRPHAARRARGDARRVAAGAPRAARACGLWQRARRRQASAPRLRPASSRGGPSHAAPAHRPGRAPAPSHLPRQAAGRGGGRACVHSPPTQHVAMRAHGQRPAAAAGRCTRSRRQAPAPMPRPRRRCRAARAATAAARRSAARRARRGSTPGARRGDGSRERAGLLTDRERTAPAPQRAGGVAAAPVSGPRGGGGACWHASSGAPAPATRRRKAGPALPSRARARPPLPPIAAPLPPPRRPTRPYLPHTSPLPPRSQFILPIFVHEEGSTNQPIASMPGIFRLAYGKNVVDHVAEARSVGINQVVIFPKVRGRGAKGADGGKARPLARACVLREGRASARWRHLPQGAAGGEAQGMGAPLPALRRQLALEKRVCWATRRAQALIRWSPHKGGAPGDAPMHLSAPAQARLPVPHARPPAPRRRRTAPRLVTHAAARRAHAPPLAPRRPTT